MSDDSDTPPPWARHLRPTLRDVTVYDVPPAKAPARLHANECPEPWPEDVTDALTEVLRGLELSRYPDTSGRELRRILGRRHDCDPERIVLGNGSDEVIALLLTALAGAGPGKPVLAVAGPTLVMYGHTARVLGYDIREVPVASDLHLDPDGMRAALAGASICFLARPNNPTGSLWDAELIHSLVAEFPDVVFVIDEAYCAYAPGQSMWSPTQPDNQVHMATLSKVGLAALRVGYCIAHPSLAGALNKVRHPYNISATSLALATTVLTRFADAQQAMIDRTLEGRAALTQMLGELAGATVFDSHANFVLVRLPGEGTASRMRAWLAEEGILVKDVSSTPGLAGCLRVGVGTQGELARLRDALQRWPAGA